MKKLLTAAFALVLLAACSKASDSFSGKEYKLVDAPDNAEITIAFDKDGSRFYGQSAVNRYFGSYKKDGNKLTLGPIGSTMMAGPGHLMAAEREYMQFLPQVATYRLDGNRLILSKANGESMVFERTGKASSLE